MKPDTQPPPSGARTVFPPTALPPSPWAHAIHKPLFIAFLLGFAFEWVTLLLGPSTDWPGTEELFWALAAATTLVGLARRLPEQNVLMSAAIIAVIAFVIAVVGDRTAVPYGPRTYSEYLGGKIAGVPWPMPLIWIVVIISCRGVARLIMRPWRKTTYYGFWVIGLACLLAVWLDLGLEPFAARVKRFWFWQTSTDVLNWYSAPWANFLGWGVTAFGILGFATPWLINKQPVKQPTDFHGLVLWLLLNLYFATGNAVNGLWLAAGASLAGMVAATICALRGARW
jgi:putative membrane protein